MYFNDIIYKKLQQKQDCNQCSTTVFKRILSFIDGTSSSILGRFGSRFSSPRSLLAGRFFEILFLMRNPPICPSALQVTSTASILRPSASRWRLRVLHCCLAILAVSLSTLPGILILAAKKSTIFLVVVLKGWASFLECSEMFFSRIIYRWLRDPPSQLARQCRSASSGFWRTSFFRI